MEYSTVAIMYGIVALIQITCPVKRIPWYVVISAWFAEHYRFYAKIQKSSVLFLAGYIVVYPFQCNVVLMGSRQIVSADRQPYMNSQRGELADTGFRP